MIVPQSTLIACFIYFAGIEDNLFKDMKLKPRDNEVEVSWDPIRLTEQPAFIRGYSLYWSGNINQNVFSVKTGTGTVMSYAV